MDCKHTPTPLRREPVGNLCVVRDDTLNSWTVLICPGLVGERKPLKQFSTRGEAEAFANEYLAKLKVDEKDTHYILRVDDCPCWQKEL